jgi:diguanylate cyclase (GGDEF)-like protein
MAVASYVMWTGLAVFGFYSGQLEISRELLNYVLIGIALTNIYFYVMIRFNFNKELADPSMTMRQLAIGMCWAMVLMLCTSEIRGAMMMVYVVTLLFGIFQLSQRSFFVLTGFALASYLGVVAIDYYLFPERFELFREIARTTILAAGLIWCSWFGNYVGRLKEALRLQNIDLKERIGSTSRDATRDHLTQSFNRRYMMKSLGREKSRADRIGSRFSVCIFDLDHFKLLNDEHGHLMGDQVLTAFAYLARQELRASDVIDLDSEGRCFGRFGGEEFICLLPSTGENGARRCAERLRKATARAEFEDDIKVTVSAGVSEYVPGETITETLRRADDALYVAKQTGRNRVAGAAALDASGDVDKKDVVVVGKFPKKGASS